jgi:protein involved in polysaccharide export with SLBB domain
MAQSSFCGGGQGGAFPSGNLSAPTSGGAGQLSGKPSQTVTYSDYGGSTSTTRSQSASVHVRPEFLTEFQKFIASTTGQVLPIFAADLFQNVPSTFAPLDRGPIPPGYIIGPDDELRVRVWGQVSFNANLRVTRAGEIFLPQVGAVHVAGLQFSELDEHLRAAVGRVYRNFDLTVDLGQIRAIQVYIAGAARRPGVYTISSLSTLVDALFATGGPSVEGSLRKIELRRNGAEAAQFDLYGLLIGGDKSKDAKLLSGDVIFIPPAGPQVAILGSVRRPAIYELRSGDTIADLMAEAGGASVVASDARISLERIVGHSARQAMEIALDNTGKTTLLAEGDILRVVSIVPQYRKTVTLRGNVSNPGRFAWHEGMRLNDLIPDRDSLLTRDYWWRRTLLGIPALEYEAVPGFSTMRQPASPVDLRYGHSQAKSTPQQSQSSEAAAGSSATAFETEATGAGDNSGGASSYMPEAGTSQQNVDQNPNQETPRPASERGSESALAEREPQAGFNAPVPTHLNTVRLSAPEIDWNYAVVERMDSDTLKTKLVPFDLGKLVIQHDETQNLELKPGDVVSIFSQADIQVPITEQTKFVRLEGEFLHAGTYSVLPGETLRALVQRAGGLTPNAYLYGSEFTRNSTRVIQQRRIDESIQSLTLEMQRGNLALAASPISSPQDLGSISAAQVSERELIAQLKQIRATGRIVLEFKPESNGPESLPDIPLENGDGFLVPSLPSTVNVVGAVFDQNSFLYQRYGQLDSYLRLAGGPNSYADHKRMFVVRANGAVISRTSVHGPWGNEFERLRMSPGDTIVVPEKSVKPSALRTVLDMTQIFSQLAFGAAAIDILK